MKDEELKENKKRISHLFNVYRNGIVADSLKQSGYPYKLIYGLQLPQLTQVAKEFTTDKDLAQALWENKKNRESRLLACYLFPHQEYDFTFLVNLINDLQTKEEAEILVFRFLRHIPRANEIRSHMTPSEPESLSEYCMNLLDRHLQHLSGQG